MPRPPALGPAFCLASVEQTAMMMEKQQPETQQSAARCEPMSRIEEHLYIGSWRDLECPKMLAAEGITHILNVAKEVDPLVHDSTLSAFNSMHIPLVDEHRENILKHLEKACEFIESAKAAHGRCLVHCRRGISRSPAIVVGYLMLREMQDYESALEFVKARRHCVSLNIAFREFLSAQPTPRSLEGTARGESEPQHQVDDTEDEVEPTPTPGTSEPESASYHQARATSAV